MQRYYTGLRGARVSTTHTFDADIASQATGGFNQAGPNTWDMSTSGFGDGGAGRFHLLWTGTENVTDVAAIRRWAPADPTRYNVMAVSFQASPWVTQYMETDPFDAFDFFGTVGE